MKKILAVVLAIFMLSAFSANALIDFNELGWTASKSSHRTDGLAQYVNQVSGGYNIGCSGAGDCFVINGPWLTINVDPMAIMYEDPFSIWKNN